MNFPVAILMSLCALSAALGFSLAAPPLWSPEIASLCFQSGLDGGQCTRAALSVGLDSTLTFAAAGVLILLADRRWRRHRPVAGGSLPPTAVALAMIATALLLTAHLTARHFGALHASRIEEIAAYSTYISLENLAWPLLLQLCVSERDPRRRLGLIGLLTGIMALTPYRAVLLTIALFGLILPMIAEIRRQRCADGGWRRFRLATLQGGLCLLLMAGALWSVYIDRIAADSPLLQDEIQHMNRTIASSWNRNPALAGELQSRRAALGRLHRRRHRRPDQPRDDTAAPPPVVQLPAQDIQTLTTLPAPLRRLAQRVTTPLFQAVTLDSLGRQQPLPDILDEILGKFRLSKRLTLNEFLYQKLYGGHGTGQTTALYYGEAIAYCPRFPLFWMILAPALVGLAWIVLRSRLIDAPVLFAVALWRSSTAGLVTILPSLVLQAGTLAAMAWCGRRPAPPWLRRLIGPVLNGVMALLILGLAFNCWETQTRRQIWNVAIAAPRPECWLTSLNDGVPDLDAALRRQGLLSRSYAGGGLSFFHKLPVLSLVQIPEGSPRLAQDGAVLAAMTSLVDCLPGTPPTPPTVLTSWTVPLNGSVPLQLLALTLLAAAFRPRTGSAAAPDV